MAEDEMTAPRRHPGRVAAAGLSLGLLACRPVFAIGWEEILIILLVGGFLFGPPLMKFLRTWNEFQESRKKKQ